MLSKHIDGVESVSFKNATHLASGSADGDIYIWDVNTGNCVRTLTGSIYGVNSVTFNNAGLLVSGSKDMTVKVWLVDTGELLRTLDGHRSSVHSVAFNNVGKIASGSNDKTVKIWDLNTGKCIQTYRSSQNIKVMFGVFHSISMVCLLLDRRTRLLKCGKRRA